MPQTRPNKGVVPVNSDAYNLAPDLATMGDSLNVVIRVASQAERDALTKVNGLLVARTDLPGCPIERCDGTNWWGPSTAEWTTVANGLNTGTQYNMGVFTAVSGSTTDSSYAIVTGSGIQVQANGLYILSSTVTWSTTIGTSRAFIQADTAAANAATPRYGRTPIGQGDDTGTHTTVAWLTAGSSIYPAIFQNTGGILNCTGRVRIGKVG